MYSSRRIKNSIILAVMAFFLISGVAACIVSESRKEDAGPAPVYVKNEREDAVTPEPIPTSTTESTSESTSESTAEPTPEPEPESREPEKLYYAFTVRADISSLNLRATPETDGKILGRLLPEQTGYVLEMGEEWSLVTTGKKSGYVSNRYIEPEEISEEDFPEEYRK